MKRIAALVLIGIFALGDAGAATQFVDFACPTPGNGSGGYTTTCDGTAAGNPATTIAQAIAASVCGDTWEFKGIHATHGSCPGSDGIYFNYDYNDLNGKACLVGTPLIYQPFGYTGPGTGETVFMDAVSAVTWTQCVWDGSACDCDAANLNVQIGAGGQTACEETWYKLGVGPYTDVVGAQNNDGTPTFRVSTKADMTNATAGYNDDACSVTTWKRCSNNAGCPSGETCTSGLSPEHDSWSTQAAGTALLVRWATNPNAGGYKARIVSSDDGITWFLRDSSYITVRGFNFRCNSREAISFVFTASGCTNCTATDNRVFYSGWKTGGGPDYGIASRKSTPVTITNNEIAYTVSEGIHTQSTAAGATVLTITGNWIHNLGDLNVLGPATAGGTPAGMILTDDFAGAAVNNYAGTVIDNNVLWNVGSGILLENRSDGSQVSNNVLKDVTNDCIKFDGTVHADNNVVFNNLCYTVGRGCIYSSAGGGGSWSGNSVYNNTFVNCANWAMEEHTAGATHSNNIFRNNLLFHSGSAGLVDFPNLTGAGGNVFQFNLPNSSAAGTIINFGGSSFTCAQTVVGANIDGTVGADSNTCVPPVFVNAGAFDFHISSGSPAKDTGTATGMPAARTTDINNTLSSLHGLQSYADGTAIQGGVWDIGIDEYLAVAPPPPATNTGKKWKRRMRGGIKRIFDECFDVLECPAYER